MSAAARDADVATAAIESLRRRAIALGLCAADAADDVVAAAIETLLEREVRVPTPTDDEARRWYDAHPDAFVAGEIVLARHILFGVTPRTPVDALRRRAEETLHELRRDPDRFAERAAELSNCPSAAQGGSLGQLVRGDSVPEFERALFADTAIGVLPALVNTRFGFHIVAIDRRIPGHRVPFDAVRGEIAARMSRGAWQRALVQYVEVLANRESAGGTKANLLVQ
jgi:peptidyl-prolyl cis-trans isomerase C